MENTNGLVFEITLNPNIPAKQITQHKVGMHVYLSHWGKQAYWSTCRKLGLPPSTLQQNPYATYEILKITNGVCDLKQLSNNALLICPVEYVVQVGTIEKYCGYAIRIDVVETPIHSHSGTCFIARNRNPGYCEYTITTIFSCHSGDEAAVFETIEEAVQFLKEKLPKLIKMSDGRIDRNYHTFNCFGRSKQDNEIHIVRVRLESETVRTYHESEFLTYEELQQVSS